MKELNAPTRQERFDTLKKVSELRKIGEINPQVSSTGEVNNHIHTWYSFSPYSPSMAAYVSWNSGLDVCGIVDHESVGGADEMCTACKAFGLGSTVGFEVRVNFYGTVFEHKKINNPDMDGVAYVLAHGLAAPYFIQTADFLEPLRKVRFIRSEKITDNLEGIFQKLGMLPVSFEKDVLPLSQYEEGGEITERHILYACAKRFIEELGKGEKLVFMLEDTLSLSLSNKIRGYLLDTDNIHYEYDLLGALKSDFLERVYVLPKEEETLPAKEFVDFAKSVHAIPTYSYLGDVQDSITGDKKLEKFEDNFLDELMDYLVDIGYIACAYMPPRNTIAQLTRVSELCKKYNLMEISGVDINSSRQEFISNLPNEFSFLNNSAWALVGHEQELCKNPNGGIFDGIGIDECISARVANYAKRGKQHVWEQSV